MFLILEKCNVGISKCHIHRQKSVSPKPQPTDLYYPQMHDLGEIHTLSRMPKFLQ